MRKAISSQQWLLVLLLTGEQQLAFSQDLSHKGKEFWLVCPIVIESALPVVYMSAGPNQATVTFTGHTEAGSWQKIYKIPANTTIVSDALPGNMVLSNLPNMERIYDRSLHIESDVPIVAYAHFYKEVYSGATMLVPEETWSYSYTAVNSPGDENSYMCVLAAHDNTVVEINPAVRTSLGSPAGSPLTITLNKGQVYQMLADMNAGELTGTTVRSIANSTGACYPVTVFSGSAGTPICSTSSDFIIQQLFPYQTWGKKYLTAPFVSTASANSSAFNTSIYRVVIHDPATVVKWNGAVLNGLVSNLYYEFHSNVAGCIEADQPVMVAQFITSQVVQNTAGNGCNFTGSGLGDPEMIVISPLEQASNRADLYLSYQAAILYNYVSLIIPTTGMASLQINGSNTFTYSYPHPNAPGYSVVIQRWIAAGKPCTIKSDSAFTGVTYGLGAYESYAYNISPPKNLTTTVLLSNRPDNGALKDSTCTRMPFKWVLQTTYTPVRIEWDMSLLPQLALNGTSAPANAIVDNPTPDSTILDDGTVYAVYSSPLEYTFTSGGLFTIPVIVTTPAIDNCSHSQTFTGQIKVNASPVAAFDLSANPVYTGDPVTVTDHSAAAGGSSINSWFWTIGEGTSTAQQPPDFRPGQAGSYPIQEYVISKEGCVSDTATQILQVKTKPIPPPPPPPESMEVPNAFSPNGDGIHDTWEIRGLSSYPAAVVQVFDRWGQKVFTSKGYVAPWDGSRNGRPLPEGTYYYIIEPGGNNARLTGALNLLR